ncbi:fimbrillin family protein [Parabacteroides sp. PF5-9]|uniref:fimbrillin family protein n=1 Tax=Parabacteroides sp. PF5-9 TaxID=1742404 RepID=UPI002473045F|nr:fimbrillin family protein [Parabacteroides sp. PF5-9]MDH6358337.1 hypothetical protein [Parabacteroides sp. PF5-9]
MKNVCFAIVFAIAVLAGCTNDESSPADHNEIMVGATVYASITKAPVKTGDEFSAAITAFEGIAAPTDWTVTPAWKNSVTITAAESGSPRVPLNTSKVYPATGNVYMRGWHPNIPSVNGVVQFAADGKEDIMWGGEVEGNKSNPVNAFVFTHSLTQLNFQIQATAEFLASNPTKRLEKIEVLNVGLPTSMQIGNGSVTYSNRAQFNLPGFSGSFLSTNLTKVGEPLMIQSVNALSVKVWYTGEANGITVPILDENNNPLNAETGKSHLVTLYFKGTNEEVIKATASVTPWETGAAGTGTIE